MRHLVALFMLVSLQGVAVAQIGPSNGSDCYKQGNCPKTTPPSPGPSASDMQKYSQDPLCSAPPPEQNSIQCLSDCADKRTTCLQNSNITGEQKDYGGYKGCLKQAEEGYQRCNKANPASWACFSKLAFDNASCNTLWLGQVALGGKCHAEALACTAKCADIGVYKRCLKSIKDQFNGP